MAQNAQKAFLQPEKGDQIPCLFNPTELSFSRSNSWSAPDMPGKGVPTLNYTGAQSGSMSLRLFFDTTDEGKPVTNYTDQLLALMEIDTSLPGSDENTNNARPPWVQFHWGSMHSFKAVVSSVSVSFTYFSSQGVPLRADVDLTLTQYEDGSVFGHKTRRPGRPTRTGRTGSSRGDPGPHRSYLLRQPDATGGPSPSSTGSRTPWPCGPDASLRSPNLRDYSFFQEPSPGGATEKPNLLRARNIASHRGERCRSWQ